MYLILQAFRGKQTTPADWHATARRGQPIIHAVKRYHDEHGEMPAKLEHLVPVHLTELPEANPDASHSELRRWHWAKDQIWAQTGAWKESITYHFNDFHQGPGWYVINEDVIEKLDLPIVTTRPTTQRAH